MKRWIFWMLFICIGLLNQTLQAQQKNSNAYFIYIQNESGTPFYVKTGKGQLLSSSPAGYIIIPQLDAGTHGLTIGFPKQQLSEEAFTFKLDHNRDAGYLLKTTGDKAFVLYNLSDYSILKPQQVASGPGNRIVQTDLPVEKPKSLPEADPLATLASPETQDTAVATNLDKPADTTPSADTARGNAFSSMLDAVTGTASSTTPAQTISPAEEAPQPASPETNKETVTGDSLGQESIAQQPENKAFPAPQQEDTGDGSNNPIIQATTDQAPVSEAQRPTKGNPKQEKGEPQFITFLPDTDDAGARKRKEILSANGINIDDQGTQQSAPPPAASDGVIPVDAAPSDTPPDSGSSQTVLSDHTAGIGDLGVQAVDSAELAANERRAQRKLKREQRKAARAMEDSLAASQELTEAAAEQPKQTEEGTPDDGVEQHLVANSDCKREADDRDFQKSRRKMASRSDEEGMLRIAEKFFGENLCYSTAQVQSFAYLFMTDEYRYKFLELAYPHTYNAGQFSSLEKTLTTDYYRGRFRAMVKK